VHKAWLIQKWFVEINMEELDWLEQSLDRNELERQLRARPNRPISVPNLTNALVAEMVM
jgi:hypothetical protein